MTVILRISFELTLAIQPNGIRGVSSVRNPCGFSERMKMHRWVSKYRMFRPTRLGTSVNIFADVYRSSPRYSVVFAWDANKNAPQK